MRVCLIHNPGAGDEEHSRDALIDSIQRFDHDLTYFDARSAWESEVDGLTPEDLVAVAGGDGTVGKVGRALAKTGVPIAVLPLGTANNISTMLGVAKVPIETLIAGWTHARRRRLDVGVASGPWATARLKSRLASSLGHSCSSPDETAARRPALPVLRLAWQFYREGRSRMRRRGDVDISAVSRDDGPCDEEPEADIVRRAVRRAASERFKDER